MTIVSFLPSALQVELTSNCNLTCRMCPLTTGETVSSRRPGAMKEAVWEAVREAAARIGRVIITGYGEALTSVECLRRLRELDALGIEMGIATNGTPLTPAISKELARLQHLVHVNVSIDSPDPGVYHEIRGGELAKALRGTENLVRAMDNSEKVTVSSVLMKENLESLITFPDILSGLGIRKWVLQSHYNHAPNSEFEDLGEGGRQGLERIQEAAARAGVSISWTIPDRVDLELEDPEQARQIYHSSCAVPSEARTRDCTIAWEIPFVDKDGRVFPCCHASTQASEVLGDLNDTPLAEIWAGDRYRKFRCDILHGDTMHKVCKNCDLVPLVQDHSYSRFSAEIIRDACKFNQPEHVIMVARNTGSVTWTRNTPVRVATSKPRDRQSALYHPSWLSPNRVTHFMEEEVPHGANATFEFRVSPTQFRQTEVFELVIDGCAWLPGTSFETPSTREEYFLNSEREDPTRSRFSAEIVHSACKFDHPEGVVIVARNTGSVIWTQDTPVHVATSKPRDRESALFHQSWVARNRAACFVESEVPPGADATFKFGVSPLEMPQTEVFELVAEGYRWLPGTSFEISPPTQEFVSESECQPRVSAGDFLRRLFWSRAS